MDQLLHKKRVIELLKHDPHRATPSISRKQTLDDEDNASKEDDDHSDFMDFDEAKNHKEEQWIVQH